MNRLDSVDSAQRRTDIPAFAPGDTVRVHVRIKESETKERLQAFEGVVIARKGDGIRETFTVRKTSFGVGVERIFPVHGPIIGKVELVRRGRVRRPSSTTCATCAARPPASRNSTRARPPRAPRRRTRASRREP